jgi:hypothetical protein
MARSTAAAVPASKIEIGRVYAIRRNDQLVRFRVEAVITRRESGHGNPQDYKSTVEGIVQAPDNDGKPVILTIQPNALLGFYEEHVELVERQKREHAEAQAKTEAHKANTEALFAAIYEATGLTPPEGDRDYGAPFRLGHSRDSIDISAKGVEPLLKFFERVKQTA